MNYQSCEKTWLKSLIEGKTELQELKLYELKLDESNTRVDTIYKSFF